MNKDICCKCKIQGNKILKENLDFKCPQCGEEWNINDGDPRCGGCLIELTGFHDIYCDNCIQDLVNKKIL